MLIIYEEFGYFDGLKIVIVGDLVYLCVVCFNMVLLM